MGDIVTLAERIDSYSFSINDGIVGGFAKELSALAHRSLGNSHEKMVARQPFCHKCGGDNVVQSYLDASAENVRLREALEQAASTLLFAAIEHNCGNCGSAGGAAQEALQTSGLTT